MPNSPPDTQLTTGEAFQIELLALESIRREVFDDDAAFAALWETHETLYDCVSNILNKNQ